MLKRLDKRLQIILEEDMSLEMADRQNSKSINTTLVMIESAKARLYAKLSALNESKRVIETQNEASNCMIKQIDAKKVEKIRLKQQIRRLKKQCASKAEDLESAIQPSHEENHTCFAKEVKNEVVKKCTQIFVQPGDNHQGGFTLDENHKIREIDKAEWKELAAKSGKNLIKWVDLFGIDTT